jgi:hypothetical protein
MFIYYIMNININMTIKTQDSLKKLTFKQSYYKLRLNKLKKRFIIKILYNFFLLNY